MEMPATMRRGELFASLKRTHSLRTSACGLAGVLRRCRNMCFLLGLVAALGVGAAETTGAHEENRRARLFYDEGLQAARRGDNEKALKAFQRAVALNPSLADAHYHLGMVLRHARAVERSGPGTSRRHRSRPEPY